MAARDCRAAGPLRDSVRTECRDPLGVAGAGKHRRNRGRRCGRPAGFDVEIYRCRNTVERCFNRLEGYRGIATRYEKTAASYEAVVTLASLLLWARSI
ncbi:transposase [Streptomyces sp. NBC_00503]|uniref:transposase n=1 Tax=Streptomyces sp. NBC_00503 TaxID=2903659 RepID=UPI002E81698D|nr:transposase [Streptomyces sp. NBC_00503]WUD85656.1 transposase [Streptomyces sp. NBC_00503]